MRKPTTHRPVKGGCLLPYYFFCYPSDISVMVYAILRIEKIKNGNSVKKLDQHNWPMHGRQSPYFRLFTSSE